VECIGEKRNRWKPQSKVTAKEGWVSMAEACRRLQYVSNTGIMVVHWLCRATKFLFGTFEVDPTTARLWRRDLSKRRNENKHSVDGAVCGEERRQGEDGRKTIHSAS
jgi:hypothetical protein